MNPGVQQLQDARRTRQIEEVLGVQPLELHSQSSMATPVQNRIEEVLTSNDQVGMQNTNANPELHNPGNRPWASLFLVDGIDLSSEANPKETRENIKITFEDIKLEVD